MAVLPIGFCRGAYQAGVVPFENSSRPARGPRVAGVTRKDRGTERHASLAKRSIAHAARALDACRPMSEIEVVRMVRHRQPRAGSFTNRI